MTTTKRVHQRRKTATRTTRVMSRRQRMRGLVWQQVHRRHGGPQDSDSRAAQATVSGNSDPAGGGHRDH